MSIISLVLVSILITGAAGRKSHGHATIKPEKTFPAPSCPQGFYGSPTTTCSPCWAPFENTTSCDPEVNPFCCRGSAGLTCTNETDAVCMDGCINGYYSEGPGNGCSLCRNSGGIPVHYCRPGGAVCTTNDNAVCLKGCNDGFYVDEASGSKACLECPSSGDLSSCNGYDNRLICTTSTDTTCALGCGPGFYEDPGVPCTPCSDAGSAMCNTNELTCTTSNDAVCVKGCKAGYYATTGTGQPCAPCQGVDPLSCVSGLVQCTTAGDAVCQQGCVKGSRLPDTWYSYAGTPEFRYRFSATPLNITFAAAYCAGFTVPTTAQLVSIHSPEENLFVSCLHSATSQNIWLGGRLVWPAVGTSKMNATLSWVDGSSVVFGSKVTPQYQGEAPWKKGQPRNIFGSQDCFKMGGRTMATWQTAFCTDKNIAVCKQSVL